MVECAVAIAAFELLIEIIKLGTEWLSAAVTDAVDVRVSRSADSSIIVRALPGGSGGQTGGKEVEGLATQPANSAKLRTGTLSTCSQRWPVC